jgi:hypothetical protein
MRHEGASFGGLSHKLISPRARTILLSFVYFYPTSLSPRLRERRRRHRHTAETAAPWHGSFLTIAGIIADR